jgi:RNA polymerase sigma-70 factor, ECF subfamily
MDNDGAAGHDAFLPGSPTPQGASFMTADAILEQYRPAITGHCYRMLGSMMDADDAVQETMLRAWRGMDRFGGRSSMKTWLYRIATNVCLDALSGRARRVRPTELSSHPGTVDDELNTRPGEHWVEPIPDDLAIPSDADPEERAILRESIRLAFVAALQYLPPRQRAVLLLTQVLNWSALEVADSLDMTTAAVNSALQRARATLGARNPSVMPRALNAEQQALVARYVDAFERYDVQALTALLHEEATLCMPPYDLWLRGHDAIAAWLLGRGAGCRGSRLVPTTACGSPAFGQYRQGGAEPWALVVLDVDGDRIRGWTSYLDTATWFPRFGLPQRLDA